MENILFLLISVSSSITAWMFITLSALLLADFLTEKKTNRLFPYEYTTPYRNFLFYLFVLLALSLFFFVISNETDKEITFPKETFYLKRCLDSGGVPVDRDKNFFICYPKDFKE